MGWFYFEPYYWQYWAQPLEHKYWGTNRDSCESDDYAQADDLRKRRWCSSLDGLMVCQQTTGTVILFHDYAFVIDRTASVTLSNEEKNTSNGTRMSTEWVIL